MNQPPRSETLAGNALARFVHRLETVLELKQAPQVLPRLDKCVAPISPFPDDMAAYCQTEVRRAQLDAERKKWGTSVRR
jgi:hypothetical protein